MRNLYSLMLSFLVAAAPLAAQSKKATPPKKPAKPAQAKTTSPASNPADEAEKARIAEKEALIARQEVAPYLCTFPVIQTDNEEFNRSTFMYLLQNLSDQKQAALKAGKANPDAAASESGAELLASPTQTVNKKANQAYDDMRWLSLSPELEELASSQGPAAVYDFQLKYQNTVKVFNRGPLYMPLPSALAYPKDAGDEAKDNAYYDLLYKWAATYPKLFENLDANWQKLLKSKNKAAIRLAAIAEETKQSQAP